MSSDDVAATLAALNQRIAALTAAIKELTASLPTGEGEDDGTSDAP